MTSLVANHGNCHHDVKLKFTVSYLACGGRNCIDGKLGWTQTHDGDFTIWAPQVNGEEAIIDDCLQVAHRPTLETHMLHQSSCKPAAAANLRLHWFDVQHAQQNTLHIHLKVTQCLSRFFPFRPPPSSIGFLEQQMGHMVSFQVCGVCTGTDEKVHLNTEELAWHR